MYFFPFCGWGVNKMSRCGGVLAGGLPWGGLGFRPGVWGVSYGIIWGRPCTLYGASLRQKSFSLWCQLRIRLKVKTSQSTLCVLYAKQAKHSQNMVLNVRVCSVKQTKQLVISILNLHEFQNRKILLLLFILFLQRKSDIVIFSVATSERILA